MKIVVFLIFFCSPLFAQADYPKDYFSPPLTVPMQLSGNFGELRPNHFHAGFDLKTLQREGLRVNAVADGYISRIKISTFGNGKAIYITHPNGYTSVYGHLQRANGSIENFIKKSHYDLQSFEIELFPKPGELPVKKGQQIAFSGNTGGSEGPHLHFEIRDTKTEKVINPMLFGFDKKIKDSKKPVVSAVYVYPMDGNTTVNRSKGPLLLHLALQKNGSYLAEKVVASGKIGFGISAVDYDDVSFNKNGVFRVQSFYNGKPNFGYQFDTYSFDEMRYINVLMDYAKYKKAQQRVQRLFMKNKFGLSIIKADETNGLITVAPDATSVYRVEVSDFYGNTSTVSIPIQYDLLSPAREPEPVVAGDFVQANKDCSFTKGNGSVFFPAGTFYEDFVLKFQVTNSTLLLHDDTVPAHSNFTISIADQTYSDAQREKLFIGLMEGQKVTYIPSVRKDNVFTAKVKTLGKYALVSDTAAPKIAIAKPVEGKWLSDQKTIQLTISDTGSGIKSYNGYLNGKWILFEYDNKTKKLIHYFSDGIVAEGANDLKVIVLDNVGNSAIFESHFFRSQKK